MVKLKPKQVRTELGRLDAAKIHNGLDEIPMLRDSLYALVKRLDQASHAPAKPASSSTAPIRWNSFTSTEKLKATVMCLEDEALSWYYYYYEELRVDAYFMVGKNFKLSVGTILSRAAAELKEISLSSYFLSPV
ncbi:hypothetical protein Dimus_007495 [Dionaea muscipula]